MPRFLECIPTKRDLDRYDQLDGSPTLKKEGCIFCDVSVDKGFKVVHQDDQLIAFHDRSPRAKTHLLIIPRYHVADSVRKLSADHLPLLASMQALAHELSPRHTKAGFHIPPFSSVPHLHLHVFEPPFTFLGRLKYPVASSKGDRGKGISWFVSLDQTIRIVQNGGRVTLGSS